MNESIRPIQAYLHEPQPVGALCEAGEARNAPVENIAVICDLGYSDTMCQPISYSDGAFDIRFGAYSANGAWAWLRGL